jgi:hypothetical protein
MQMHIVMTMTTIMAAAAAITLTSSTIVRAVAHSTTSPPSPSPTSPKGRVTVNEDEVTDAPFSSIHISMHACTQGLCYHDVHTCMYIVTQTINT